MIALFTDFGFNGPYVGQMKAVLAAEAPTTPVIDLMHDAPRFDARASAYLLAAITQDLPPGSVCIAVVDPGVGSERDIVVVEADGRRFVGPDNGLLAIVARRARKAHCWRLDWQPQQVSASFHGRDIMVPVAAMMVRGEPPLMTELDLGDMVGSSWPEDLDEIIYIDDFGNAVSGQRASVVSETFAVECSGMSVSHAETFSAVAEGEVFWYENSSGLVELAVNQGRADELPGIHIGSRLGFRQD